MDAIILAGGLGTRLQKTIGKEIPKPLALINNKPFLDILIAELEKHKIIENIILAVSHKKEKIIERYKDKKNIFFSEENPPLGTGGAIKKALTFTKSNEVLALNGDSHVIFAPQDLLKKHLNKNADITICYRSEKEISRYGSIEIEYETNKIICFNEKKNSNNSNNTNCYINAGVYLLNKNVFKDFYSKNVFSIEKDFFPKALLTKNVFGYKILSSFIDIGTHESYHRAQNLLNLN